MEPDLWHALPGALARGGLTALCVGVLLLAAQRLGRGAAGLLAGLPTVTGPALLWLALDRGAGFGAQAAVGAVAAGVVCALFALVHAVAAGRCRPLPALALAAACCAVPLPWLAQPPWSLGIWLLAATAVCLVCQRALGVVGGGMVTSAAGRGPAAMACGRTDGRAYGLTRAALTTAIVSGAVSALAAGSAHLVGPFWAGVLTSPPLLAAAVAFELHRHAGGVQEMQRFLHGYVAGLVGRGLFVAAFGVLLPAAGTPMAFALALALSLVAGGLSGARLARAPAAKHATGPATMAAGSEKGA